jgi:hypothetical protein
MKEARFVKIKAHDLPAGIYPASGSIEGTGDGYIDRAEDPPVGEKAVHASRVDIFAHDLPSVIDPRRHGLGDAGERHVERSESARPARQVKCPALLTSPTYPLTLRQSDQARSDFAAIESDLRFVMSQLARLPSAYVCRILLLSTASLAKAIQ